MRIGIDLGGTKTEGILLAPVGAILRRVRKPTPRDDYDGTLATIRDIVADMSEENVIWDRSQPAATMSACRARTRSRAPARP